MNLKGWVVLAAAVLATGSGLAQTPALAEDYRLGCAAVAEAEQWSEVPPEHRPAATACLGAVSVLLHTGRTRGICPPAPVAQPDAAAVVARYIEENPDATEEAFRSVAQAALAEEFPCEGDKR